MGLGKLLKLLLWLQFIRRGMISSLVRYYSGVWLSAGLVIGGTFGLMLAPPRYAATTFGPTWLMLALCAVSIPVAYLFARTLGPIPLAVVCVVLPGIFIITPQRSGSAQLAIENRGEDTVLTGFTESILGTSDFYLFAKGSLVAAVLSAGSYLVFRTLQVPSMMGRWSFRWTSTLAIIIVGVCVLELLRNVIGTYPGVRMPWSSIIARITREPGWPKAICVWLWLNMALLLAMYDDRLIPYLLHRTGHQWAPSRLLPQDAFMIDSLLAALEDLRRKGSDGHPSSRRSRSRRD